MLRHSLLLLALLGAASLSANEASPFGQPASEVANTEQPMEWQVYFSPNGGAQAAVLAELAKARETIRVQAFTFSNVPIAQALVQARARGVDVKAILDASQQADRYNAADYLSRHGVPTFLDARHPMAHDQVLIIDKTTVVTGSFSYTKAAEESNAESLMVVHNAPEMAARFDENWRLHLQHSALCAGRK